MNQPTNIWLMVDKKIDEIVNVLNLAQTNYTAAAGQEAYPTDIHWKLEYTMVRLSPTKAL